MPIDTGVGVSSRARAIVERHNKQIVESWYIMINYDIGYTLSVRELKEIAEKREGATIDTARITLCDTNDNIISFIWVTSIVVWSNRIEFYIGSSYTGCIMYDYFSTIDILK